MDMPNICHRLQRQQPDSPNIRISLSLLSLTKTCHKAKLLPITGGSVYNIVQWVRTYIVGIDSTMELAMTLSDCTSQAYLPCASDSEHDQIIVVTYGAHNHD